MASASAARRAAPSAGLFSLPADVWLKILAYCPVAMLRSLVAVRSKALTRLAIRSYAQRSRSRPRVREFAESPTDLAWSPQSRVKAFIQLPDRHLMVLSDQLTVVSLEGEVIAEAPAEQWEESLVHVNGRVFISRRVNRCELAQRQWQNPRVIWREVDLRGREVRRLNTDGGFWGTDFAACGDVLITHGRFTAQNEDSVDAFFRYHVPADPSEEPRPASGLHAVNSEGGATLWHPCVDGAARTLLVTASREKFFGVDDSVNNGHSQRHSSHLLIYSLDAPNSLLRSIDLPDHSLSLRSVAVDAAGIAYLAGGHCDIVVVNPRKQSEPVLHTHKPNEQVMCGAGAGNFLLLHDGWFASSTHNGIFFV